MAEKLDIILKNNISRDARAGSKVRFAFRFHAVVAPGSQRFAIVAARDVGELEVDPELGVEMHQREVFGFEFFKGSYDDPEIVAVHGDDENGFAEQDGAVFAVGLFAGAEESDGGRTSLGAGWHEDHGG